MNVLCIYSLFFLYSLWFHPLKPQTDDFGHFEITEDLSKAYQDILLLKFEDARNLIEKIKIDDPENLLIYHIENYIDFFTIFIGEEKSALKKLESNKDYRLRMIRRGSKSSPYYKFSQAEILLQWALARSKFYDDAKLIDLKMLNELNQAYRLLESNELEHPDFIANKKSLSLMHALAGYLPGLIKKLFRIKGSLDLGRKEIEDLVQAVKGKDFIFQDEVSAIYSYMLLHLFNQPEKAWDYLKDSRLDPSQSPLACFLLSTIAMKTGRNDLAIQYLENRPKGNEYFEFYYLDYLEGKGRLFNLDSSAQIHLNYFLNHFRGRHFIKDAYQKLAWYELVINGNEYKYVQYMEQCKKTGRKFLEDDLQALNEAKTGSVPNIVLLKARLLFDGGYYHRAQQILQSNSNNMFEDRLLKVEFHYRMARVAQALGSDDEAIQNYLKTLSQENNENSFFATNSNLQIGLILESQGKMTKAKEYFENCLQLKPEIYKDQLHNKAKAGITRIEQGIIFN